MLDGSAFVREMSLLHRRFGREPDEQVIARYFDTLKERLTTEEFASAARHVFDHDAFWPTPMRFVELARGTPERAARQEWLTLMNGARKGERMRLSSAGEAALMAAGGWRIVAYANEEHALPRLERAFVRAYQDASESASMAALTDSTLDLDEA